MLLLLSTKINVFIFRITLTRNELDLTSPTQSTILLDIRSIMRRKKNGINIKDCKL